MKTELFLALEQAIEKTIEDKCEAELWNGYIHPSLYAQMAKAAALVFDASMDGQEFAEEAGK